MHIFFCSSNTIMLHHHHNHQHDQPCLHCHPHTYIRMVQNLIERCLLLQMNRDDCVAALATHASIQPQITLTVWNELHKENIDFFRSYLHNIYPRPFNCRPPLRIARSRRKMSWK